MRSDMHADNTHNDKPGFFSKIFGHGDDAATPTENTASTAQVVQPATVVQPTDPTTPGETTEPTAPATPPTPAPAVTEPELQAGSMSDVHAIPGGATEALDLSASTTSQAAAPAAAPADDDMFQMPDIKIADDEGVNSEVPVIVPGETKSDEAGEEVLFDSTQPEPAETLAAPEAPAETPAETPTEPEAPSEPAAEPTPEPTPTPDVEPPAPPVEEGQAWQAAHDKPSAEPEETQGELSGAQTQVNSILATHPDLTTDRSESAAPVEPVAAVSPLEKDHPTPAAPSEPDTSNTSERQAAVVRLTNHIDDLEAGLQKVRDELDALKK